MTSTLPRPVLAAVAALCFALPAAAQFRPPPASEVERITFAGDDARTEAADRLARGDKAGAQSELKKAISLYEKAIALNPNHTAAAAGLGAAGVALGDFERVAKALSPIHAAHPEDDEVTFQLGVALFKLKRYEEASERLAKVAPLNKPDHLLAHYYLGWYYLYAGRGEAAVAALLRYLQLRPPALAKKDGEVQQLLGRGYLLIRRPVEARQAYELALKAQPDSMAVQMGLSAVLEMEGKQKEAVALLQSIAAKNPSAPEPKERLGRLLLQAGDLARADAVAAELFKLKPTSGAHLLRGDVRLAQKQYPAAEDDLRRALQLSPGNLTVQISLARALQKQNKNDEAIGLLEKAIAAGANTNEALASLGSIYRRAGRFQKAVEVHQKVVAANPTLALGHILVGADHFATGQWDLAIDQYAEANKLEPDNLGARHWLALALNHRARGRADAGRLDDAGRDLRRAFDLERSVVMARSLSALLLTQRNFEEARKVLAEAVKLPGATYKDHVLLGYAALGAKDPAGAVTAYENAAKLTQNEAALADIYAGWSLAKLELGEFDTAVAKLMEPGKSKSASFVTQGNLPRALIARAVDHLKQGNTAAAAKDTEQAEKLGVREPEVKRLIAFSRALVDLEEGKHDEALRGLRASLTGERWNTPQARPLLEAYVEYRRGRMPNARRLLAAGERRADPAKQEWAKEFAKAINRRDGERSYVEGNLAAAQKALKAAFDAEPLNPFVISNLACVQYRKGQVAPAVAAWQGVEGAVPEAALNLGIDAQERQKNYSRAVESYRKYIAANGPRSIQVRDWKERLESIYGLSEVNVQQGGSP